jgi:hypothetical protein
MTIPQLRGIVKFNVQGQEALPKWMQTAIQNALAVSESPPESLRYQCRIATDAHENFKNLTLENGETLRLHNAKPQFGRNHDGKPYLTVTMIYSGDGLGYRIRWIGANVPTKMVDVAIKHDKGLAVAPTTIGLDLTKAEVTPSWKVQGRSGPRDYSQRVKQATENPGTHRKRHCARVTETDAK